MDILILLLYSLLCWTIFKVFKVPVNKWTLTTAVLGGVMFIITIILLMNYNHPYTSNSRSFFVSTPIIPNVTSEVISVHVEEHEHVKKGDTLFVMDNTVFISRLNSLLADLKLAKLRLEESEKLFKARAGSAYDVEFYQSQINKFNAELIEARYNVRECIVRAPTDGLVAMQRLRPGMRAVQFPLRPVMTFVDTEKHFIVAAMPQNPLQQLEVGNHAEVIFDAIPGKIFKGEVSIISNVVALGELQTSGTLYNFDWNLPHGHVPQGSVPIVIELTEDVSAYNIPGGAKAQAAIYSNHMEPVKIVRMILMRMKGWLNYVFGEH